MAGEREVERKYSVDSRFVLPRLTSLPGVASARTRRAVTLEAVYYDSDDLRLARSGITLRRRTGGADAGWHLKLPVGGDEREEIRRPLEPADPAGRAGRRGARSRTAAGGGRAGQGRRSAGAAAAAGAFEEARNGAAPAATATATAIAAEAAPAAEASAAEAFATKASAVEVPATSVAAAAVNGARAGAPPADGTPAPPADLVDLVAARLRGAELRPVARVVTLRTARRLRDADGRDLAEVVDDQVSARILGWSAPGQDGADGAAQNAAQEAVQEAVQKWREIEVELAGGDPALLDEIDALLTGAGAQRARVPSKLAQVLGPRLAELPGPELPRPPARLRRRTPAGEVIRAYLVAQVDALLAVDPRVRQDEPDSVHKMRVACRRLRSTLRTFAPFFPAGLASRLDGELRDLAGALSGARDAEVQIDYFAGRLAELPEELVRGPVAETISAHLGSGRAASRAEALAMLRSERYLTLISDLVDLVNGPLAGDADQPAGKVLPGMVLRADRQLARKVAKAARLPAGPRRDERLHSARKQAKRLRYAAEALIPVHGSDAAGFARLAEQIQELLGTHQDACVARALLREWGLAAQRAGEPTAFTLGLLLGLEEGRARAAEREFFALWPKLSADRHRRWLT